MRTEPSAAHWLIHLAVRNDAISPWFMSMYRILGGRPVRAGANVRVHKNRMWGADFSLMTWANPGTGRNNGQPYFVIAGSVPDRGLSLIRCT
jgi:hypothetical protein